MHRSKLFPFPSYKSRVNSRAPTHSPSKLYRNLSKIDGTQTVPHYASTLYSSDASLISINYKSKSFRMNRLLGRSKMFDNSNNSKKFQRLIALPDFDDSELVHKGKHYPKEKANKLQSVKKRQKNLSKKESKGFYRKFDNDYPCDASTSSSDYAEMPSRISPLKTSHRKQEAPVNSQKREVLNSAKKDYNSLNNVSSKAADKSSIEKPAHHSRSAEIILKVPTKVPVMATKPSSNASQVVITTTAPLSNANKLTTNAAGKPLMSSAKSSSTTKLQSSINLSKHPSSSTKVLSNGSRAETNSSKNNITSQRIPSFKKQNLKKFQHAADTPKSSEILKTFESLPKYNTKKIAESFEKKCSVSVENRNDPNDVVSELLDIVNTEAENAICEEDDIDEPEYVSSGRLQVIVNNWKKDEAYELSSKDSWTLKREKEDPIIVYNDPISPIYSQGQRAENPVVAKANKVSPIYGQIQRVEKSTNNKAQPIYSQSQRKLIRNPNNNLARNDSVPYHTQMPIRQRLRESWRSEEMRKHQTRHNQNNRKAHTQNRGQRRQERFASLEHNRPPHQSIYFNRQSFSNHLLPRPDDVVFIAKQEAAQEEAVQRLQRELKEQQQQINKELN